MKLNPFSKSATSWLLALTFALLSTFNLAQASNGTQPTLLPAEEAFAFDYKIENGKINLNWKIAEGYHIYRDKIKAKTVSGTATIGALGLPEAIQTDDPIFGKTWVYHGDVTVTLTPSGVSDGAQIVVGFQGCSVEAGVCYPPMKKTITLNSQDFSNNTATTSVAAKAPESTASAKEAMSETDQITDTLKNSSIWVVLGTFFLFGLLLALTPCVFPMIPILSSIIVGQGDKLSTQRAFIMSVVYVLAMSITYTAAGVLAGLFGENLQAAFQNPWIIGTFSLIFVALAFSMFGFYELKLPNSLQSKITNLSNKQEGGTLTGVGIMGFLSALIVGPCVAPPLAGALIYIGQTGDALLGGSALFVMSLGMGLPLILLGTSAGKLMPRAGGWMNQVTIVFGVVMLAIAIWMAERVLPAVVANLLWAALLIGSAIYMGTLNSTENKSGWGKLFHTIGFLFILYGTLIIIGIAGGSQSLLKPLEVFKGGTSAQAQAEQGLVFERVKTLDELQQQITQATANGKTVMLDFYADWCISCKEMEHLTFVDGRVIKSLENTVLLQADVTDNNEQDKIIMKSFGIVGPPAILFFKDGVEVKSQRVVGFKEPEAFINNIQQSFK